MDNEAKKAYSFIGDAGYICAEGVSTCNHAIGTGKRGIYIWLLLVCCMFGVNQPKCIVMSLHNALLIMHHMQYVVAEAANVFEQFKTLVPVCHSL